MRTLVAKPKGPHQAKRAKSIPSRTHLKHNHGVNSILHLQRTIGNQAVQRLLSVHTNGTPADKSEQKADRAAEQVMRMPGPVAGPAAGSTHTAPRGDHTLSPQERSFFEPRFGHDFSQVRIHADAKSSRMADALNAEAFTYGRDIYFGSGNRDTQARAGANPLLAHELAHVVQQSHTGPQLQPKLKITGTEDHLKRAQALLHGGLGGFYHVSIDEKSGVVKIEPVRSAHQSSATGPSAQQKALAEHLTTVINDSKDVNMTVSSGSTTVGGSYATADFDIADLEHYGVGGLLHEIVEQHQKQTKGLAYEDTKTPGAHSAAVAAEAAVRGAVRGTEKVVSQKANADGTMDAVIEIPHTFPDKSVKTMVIVMKSNNFTSVTWK